MEKRYGGTVIHGDGEGRRLGYPTANIAIQETLSGIWAGTVAHDGREYPAAVFASKRRPILEAHLLDFEGDLYGQDIVISMTEPIRDERAFASIDELKAVIAKDVQKVRECLRVPPCSPAS